MLNLIKMQFKSESFKRFNIIAISLTFIAIMLSLIFKTQYFEGISSIYSLSTFILAIFIFNLENNKMNILLNSLPIKKQHIVYKNYIFLFVIYLLVLIYSQLYVFIISKINSTSMGSISIIECIVFFPILIMQINIMLPILHLSSDRSSYIMVFFGFYIVLSIFSPYYVEISKMILDGKVYILFILAVLTTVISIAISVFFYSNRNFEREIG